MKSSSMRWRARLVIRRLTCCSDWFSSTARKSSFIRRLIGLRANRSVAKGLSRASESEWRWTMPHGWPSSSSTPSEFRLD
ncbi:hypothetical protein D3C81_1626510 [compost metagenome]